MLRNLSAVLRFVAAMPLRNSHVDVDVVVELINRVRFQPQSAELTRTFRVGQRIQLTHCRREHHEERSRYRVRRLLQNRK
jgi:hypothetical protein